MAAASKKFVKTCFKSYKIAPLLLTPEAFDSYRKLVTLNTYDFVGMNNVSLSPSPHG
jgi:hypothetical protein